MEKNYVLVDSQELASIVTSKIREEIAQVTNKLIQYGEVKTVRKKANGGWEAQIRFPGSTVNSVYLDCLAHYVPIVSDWIMILYPPGSSPVIVGEAPAKENAILTPDDVFATKTTADATYYVRIDGNDANNGLANNAAGAFRTIQKILNSLPQFINHNININIADGNYGESVDVFGFFGEGVLTITGNPTTPTNVKVNSFWLRRNYCAIICDGIEATTTTADAFIINRNKDVWGKNFRCTAAAAYNGILIQYSTVWLQSCIFSNRSNGIDAQMTSTVFSDNNSGTGNTVGIRCINAAKVGKSGSQPSGTTAEVVSTGATISGGVINPWGDNTRNSRPLLIVEGAVGQVFATGVWYVIKFNSEVRDNLGNYDPATGNFVAPKTGTYEIKVGISITNMAAGWWILGAIEKNGVLYKYVTDMQYGTSAYLTGSGSILIDLNAGDTVRYVMSQAAGNGASLDTNSQVTFMHIIQVA